MAGDGLARRLSPLFDERTTTEVALAAVVEAYNEETGRALDPGDLTGEQRADLRNWLTALTAAGDAVASLMYRQPHLEHLPLFADMASKASWLKQHRCPVCHPLTPPRFFPIEIPPWSHQAAPGVGAALRKAIDANRIYREAYTPIPKGTGVCLRFVFVLADDATMKDCDNMAKGLADAFQGLLYEDDAQVEHLDLFKLHGTGAPNGYVLARYFGTKLNDHGEVIDRQHAEIKWMDAETLKLHEFLPPSPDRGNRRAVDPLRSASPWRERP